MNRRVNIKKVLKNQEAIKYHSVILRKKLKLSQNISDRIFTSFYSEDRIIHIYISIRISVNITLQLIQLAKQK